MNSLNIKLLKILREIKKKMLYINNNNGINLCVFVK